MLRNGVELPRIGLGVFKAPRGAGTREVVSQAISLGYRHFDTAYIYGNERDVADGIRDSGIPRAEIFVTTKLWNDFQGYDTALRALDASLGTMHLDYIDLYLMHWPVPGKRLDSWRAMEKILADGRARAIGVSNFMPRHLAELFANANEMPAVNQIEVSPFLQERGARSVCAEHGIVVEAYSPLTRGVRLGHPVVVEIAGQLSRTPAQVLLRWGLQSDLVVLPKSVRPERLAENLDLYSFSLSKAQMARLNGLEEGLVTGWDPRSNDWD
jgi:diketogulonate reductase-like aldo/keto reductase